MWKKYGVCSKILLEEDKCIGYIEFAPPMFFKTLGEYDGKWINILRNGFKVADTSIENYPLVKRILKY